MTLELTGVPAGMKLDPAPKSRRILLVYSRIPFPMTRGDQLTVAHLLQFWKERGHDVDAVFLDSGGSMSAEQQDWLEDKTNSLTIVSEGKLRSALLLASGLLRGLPAQVALFDSRRQRKAVRELAESGDYDLVYCYYVRSAEPTLKALGGLRSDAKAFLALQLSQSLNCERIAETDSNPMKRLFFKFEAWRMRRYEAKVVRDFDVYGVIGQKDLEAVQQAVESVGRRSPTTHIFTPHGTDIERFSPAINLDIDYEIIFSGNMQYEPNVRAVEWFVENCWSEIRLARPDARFAIVGRSPSSRIHQLVETTPGLLLHRDVPEIADYIKRASICINPMQAAGGMQNKLVEYLSSGKPVVATSIANEGIGAPSDAIVIADSASEFTSAVLDLLDDAGRCAELSSNARSFVESNWSWAAHFLRQESALLEV